MSSRTVIQLLIAGVVLNSAAVASTMVWSQTATPAGTRIAAAAPDFDYVFASVATQPQRDATAAPDFDKSFAAVSGPRPENTPPNRERLRNIGWRRILGS